MSGIVPLCFMCNKRCHTVLGVYKDGKSVLQPFEQPELCVFSQKAQVL